MMKISLSCYYCYTTVTILFYQSIRCSTSVLGYYTGVSTISPDPLQRKPSSTVISTRLFDRTSSSSSSVISSFPTTLVEKRDGSTTTSKKKNVLTTTQYWNFQGHDCYTEISKPTTNHSSSSSATSLSSIFNQNQQRQKRRPEIVLIHGFGCSTVYWRETTNALVNDGYTVHAIDLLGQGKSTKPGRDDKNVIYSIHLWSKLVEEYTQQFISKTNGIVLIGNSLGSVVALSAATGDHDNDNNGGLTNTAATLPSRIQGIGMYNCGIGMNSRNLLKDPQLNAIQKVVFTYIFDIFDTLIFGNIPLLTYVLDKVVTKDLLRNALLGLYKCSSNPYERIDDSLVNSFYIPAKDVGSPDVLSQIYTNDAGKTPMELHKDHSTLLNKIPIHLIWGTKDTITPISGPVGQFYMNLINKESSAANVSINVVEAGHIPFDEIPECNESMVQWLNDVVMNFEITNKPNRSSNNNKANNNNKDGIFKWPFSK